MKQTLFISLFSLSFIVTYALAIPPWNPDNRPHSYTSDLIHNLENGPATMDPFEEEGEHQIEDGLDLAIKLEEEAKKSEARSIMLHQKASMVAAEAIQLDKGSLSLSDIINDRPKPKRSARGRHSERHVSLRDVLSKRGSDHMEDIQLDPLLDDSLGERSGTPEVDEEIVFPDLEAIRLIYLKKMLQSMKTPDQDTVNQVTELNDSEKLRWLVEQLKEHQLLKSIEQLVDRQSHHSDEPAGGDVLMDSRLV